MSDTERLDWLEAHPDRALAGMRYKGAMIYWARGDEDYYPTVRQAIDAAIEAEKRKEME